ncbi:ISAs1 family transposase [Pasteurella testudinis]|uniref:ISAs1 family transposase n=1 Tax=Pasteurella testudinis TaxID=761 RepID=UPI004058E6FD
MDLFRFFGQLEDPRKDINQKYPFLEIIFLTMSAVISGAEGWTDIKRFGEYHLAWLRQYLPFERGIPVDDTIARIVRRLSPVQLNDIFIHFVNEIRAAQGVEQIAIDGKTLRHGIDDKTQNALHSITVWSKTRGLILTQQKSSGWKNEQQGVLAVLDALILKNAVISVDAINTQKKIAEKIIEKKGHYVMALKRNHRLFREEAQAYFHKIERETPDLIEVYQEVNCERSRIDERTYRQLPVSDWLSEAAEWAGIQSVVCVERRREDKKSGQVQEERAFYISSLKASAEQLSHSIRGHWEVENKAHWVLDMVYREDDCVISKDDGAENMAILRRFALNLSRLHPAKMSMRMKLKAAGWSDEFRSELMFGVVG